MKIIRIWAFSSVKNDKLFEKFYLKTNFRCTKFCATEPETLPVSETDTHTHTHKFKEREGEILIFEYKTADDDLIYFGATDRVHRLQEITCHHCSSHSHQGIAHTNYGWLALFVPHAVLPETKKEKEVVKSCFLIVAREREREWIAANDQRTLGQNINDCNNNTAPEWDSDWRWQTGKHDV